MGGVWSRMIWKDQNLDTNSLGDHRPNNTPISNDLENDIRSLNLPIYEIAIPDEQPVYIPTDPDDTLVSDEEPNDYLYFMRLTAERQAREYFDKMDDEYVPQEPDWLEKRPVDLSPAVVIDEYTNQREEYENQGTSYHDDHDPDFEFHSSPPESPPIVIDEYLTQRGEYGNRRTSYYDDHDLDFDLLLRSSPPDSPPHRVGGSRLSYQRWLKEIHLSKAYCAARRVYRSREYRWSGDYRPREDGRWAREYGRWLGQFYRSQE